MFSQSAAPLLEPSPKQSLNATPRRPSSSHGVFPLRSALKQPTSSLSGSSSRPTTPNPSQTTISSGSRPQSPRPILTRSQDSGEQIPTNIPTNNGLLTAPAGYTHKVSFDTFENPSDEGMFSYTLQVKTEKYTRRPCTRVFLCAASNDESGKRCLEWVLESLVQNYDELVVLRGFDFDVLDNQQSVVRQEAHDFMSAIQSRNKAIDPERQLSIVVEFVAGKVTQTIERLIALYRPDSLIVGTRGQRGKMQTWGAALHVTRVGKVSRWCLSHSPVPVIVVRPERKVKKTMEKRLADPRRSRHFQDQITKEDG